MGVDAMIVDRPAQFPGQCLDGDQGVCIDTHIELPAYGHIYVSKRQARDHGRLLGMVAREDHAEVHAKVAALEIRVRELETELAEAEPILRSLARAEARYGGGD